MYRRPLPANQVEASLQASIDFSKAIIPLLRVACKHVKEDIERLPPGGARQKMAERQLAPSLVRLRMHQVIEGYNLRCLNSGIGKPLQLGSIRNGAVCLLHNEQEHRLLKASKEFPTTPAGFFQEALITQKRYWDYVTGGSLFDDFPPPPLNGLIYYTWANFEPTGGYVVIPDGFKYDRTVRVADQAELDLYGDLEDTARFSGVINISHAGQDLILGAHGVDPVQMADPYADVEELDVEPIDDAVLGFDSVLESEEEAK
jgi:hypothetical protein